MIRNISFVVLALIVFACSRAPEGDGCIDLNENQDVSFYDVFQEVDAIQLETSEHSYISRINKVLHHQKKLFAFDSSRQVIFCFSENGEFLRQIGRQGNGPGEYNHVSDIAIDASSNHLYILEPVIGRVQWFDLDGNYINSTRIDSDGIIGLSRMFVVSDSVLVISSLNPQSYFAYKRSQDKVMTFLQVHDEVVGSVRGFRPSMFFYDGSVYCLDYLKGEVFEFAGDGFHVSHSFCFGEMDNSDAQINEVFANSLRWATERRSIQFEYLVGRGRYLNHLITSVFENDRFFLANMEYEGDFKNIVMDKKSGNEYVFNYFREGLQFPMGERQGSMIISNNNQFVPRSAEWYSRAFPLDAEYYIRDDSRSHTFFTRDMLTERGKQVYNNHDPMHDNPYLIIFKFKE